MLAGIGDEETVVLAQTETENDPSRARDCHEGCLYGLRNEPHGKVIEGNWAWKDVVPRSNFQRTGHLSKDVLQGLKVAGRPEIPILVAHFPILFRNEFQNFAAELWAKDSCHIDFVVEMMRG